jgi:membrane protease YdiL (CAAX protease family)
VNCVRVFNHSATDPSIYVRYWERNNLKALGLSSPLLRSLLLGIGAWLLFELFLPLLLRWEQFITPVSSATGALHGLPPLPPVDQEVWSLSEGWFYVLVVADVIFEELVTRAYLIERLTDFIGNIWLAGAISLVLSVALHILHRDFHAALFRAPLALLLVAVYAYSRSLVACCVLHFMWDTIPMWMDRFPWLIRWIFSSTRVSLLLLVTIVLYLVARRSIRAAPSSLHSLQGTINPSKLD